jgi:pSer/pThr/pTyr-binding forkhead associated (FHA) protein
MTAWKKTPFKAMDVTVKTMRAYLIPSPVESFSKPILLSRQETTIGREPGNTIVIPRQTVSRRHAKIVCENGHYHLVDLK